MSKRPCLDCGTLTDGRPERENLRAGSGPMAGTRPSTHARGYGRRHQDIRAAHLQGAYGQPCLHCGQTMTQDQDLDLDHTDDRLGYRGFAHAGCNRSAGARKGNAARKRNATPEKIRSRDW